MRVNHEKKSDGVRVYHERKSDGGRVENEKKSNVVRVDHEKKSDGVRVFACCYLWCPTGKPHWSPSLFLFILTTCRIV